MKTLRTRKGRAIFSIGIVWIATTIGIMYLNPNPYFAYNQIFYYDPWEYYDSLRLRSNEDMQQHWAPEFSRQIESRGYETCTTHRAIAACLRVKAFFRQHTVMIPIKFLDYNEYLVPVATENGVVEVEYFDENKKPHKAIEEIKGLAEQRIQSEMLKWLKDSASIAAIVVFSPLILITISWFLFNWVLNAPEGSKKQEIPPSHGPDQTHKEVE